MGPERAFLARKYLILALIWSVYMYCFYVMEAFLQYTVGDDYTD
jgi:hypothetical protein